eukprot:TRINITY_DN4122_c0_g1_i1.p2 TRINITY_DN4122_c0_g1~~TRINITY_DN4122_c0_g1_i1.p2  ORF type:complete len:332 (+),score=128.51 TRINITY_DN4122_c0_g1_i1:56-997(+)
MGLDAVLQGKGGNLADNEKEYLQKQKAKELVDDLLSAALQENAQDLPDFCRRKLAEKIKADLKFKAVIFDLDGCITKTAAVHSRAWKAMFDSFLKTEAPGAPLPEFTPSDYLKYVDGRPRYEGVQNFLKSRNIDLPMGDPSDEPGAKTLTCCSLGNRKNDFFMEVLNNEGVEVYPSSVRIIQSCRDLGIRLGVASSSKNAAKVLDTAGLSPLIEERVDGVVSADIGLKGKPAGDIFVTCCERLGCKPSEAIVVEDATSGVEAGRNGKFRLVIGLAREDNQEELKKFGAHVVVDDFHDATLTTINEWFQAQPEP